MPASSFYTPRPGIAIVTLLLAWAGGFAVARLSLQTSISGMASANGSNNIPDGPAAKASSSRRGATEKGADETAFSVHWEWIERLRGAGAAEFPALWKEIMNISNQYARRSVRDLLYGKWLQTDPAGCLEFLAKEDKSQKAGALAMWLKEDPDAACAWAGSGTDEKTIRDSTRLVFEQLAAVDPEKFLALAATAKEDLVPSESIQAAFRKLAKKDPKAALAALAAAGPKMRNNGSWGLGVEWGKTNPTAAFDWAKNLTDPVEKQSALRGVLASWARTDPEAVMAHLDLLEDVKDAKGQSPKTAVVTGLATKDPRKAFDFVIASFTNRNERAALLSGTVFPKLAATMKPEQIAALLDEAKLVRAVGRNASISSDSGSIFVTNGFDNTLLGAGSLLPDQPDPGGSFRTLTTGEMTLAAKLTATGMARQWVEKDPQAAIGGYESMPAGPGRELLAGALLSLASTTQNLDLLARVEKDLGSNGESPVEQATRYVAKSDPGKALAWADQQSSASSVQAQVRKSAVQFMAGYDTAGALAYADQRPVSEQPDLYGSISSVWGESDSYGNSQWVASLPPGANRDNAAVALITHLGAQDPVSALEWAKSIQDEKLQSSSYISTFSQWARQDATSAEQALQALPLTASLKERLTQQINSVRKSR